MCLCLIHQPHGAQDTVAPAPRVWCSSYNVQPCRGEDRPPAAWHSTARPQGVCVLFASGGIASAKSPLQRDSSWAEPRRPGHWLCSPGQPVSPELPSQARAHPVVDPRVSHTPPCSATSSCSETRPTTVRRTTLLLCRSEDRACGLSPQAGEPRVGAKGGIELRFCELTPLTPLSALLPEPSHRWAMTLQTWGLREAFISSAVIFQNSCTRTRPFS